MQQQQSIKPGILLISTGKYKQFVEKLILQIDKYFLKEHHKKIFLFTDEWQPNLRSINQIVQILIPSYRFPYASLYRYDLFSKHSFQLQSCSHLYYFDVDSAIVNEIGEQFIVEGLLAVRHPGFYRQGGWGDSNNPEQSTSYLPKELRKCYYCGGVQGGATGWYLTACKQMADGILKDEVNNIIAEHNDETHWNKLLHTENMPIAEFNPTYGMVEQPNLRKAWGIDDLPVKIIFLSKNHAELRS